MTDTTHPPQTPDPGVMGDSLTVRGRLALLGWPSLNDWGRAHGYYPALAQYAVKQWSKKPVHGRQPQGLITARVVADLRRTLTQGLRPQDVKPVQQTA